MSLDEDLDPLNVPRDSKIFRQGELGRIAILASAEHHVEEPEQADEEEYHSRGGVQVVPRYGMHTFGPEGEGSRRLYQRPGSHAIEERF